MSFLRHGESIDPMNVLFHWEQASASLPVLIGLDEFQPAIPWQVTLQQSLPPLRGPCTILQNTTSPYNDLSTNGNNPLNSVSQHKGALHSGPPLAVSGFRLRARLGSSIPFSFSGQRGITPAFGYSAPHLSVGGTLTLLNFTLLSGRDGWVGLSA